MSAEKILLDPNPAARRLGLDLGLIGALSVACAVAAYYLNKLVPDELTTKADIVGHPTVFAFNIDKYHYLYYSQTFVLLIIVAIGFLLLRRFIDRIAPEQRDRRLAPTGGPRFLGPAARPLCTARRPVGGRSGLQPTPAGMGGHRLRWHARCGGARHDMDRVSFGTRELDRARH